MRLIDVVAMVGDLHEAGAISPDVAVDMIAEKCTVSRALATALLVDDTRARSQKWAALGDDWGRWEAS